MTIKTSTYVPILKWRQGEYQALMRLSDSVKDQIVPLIVVPPVEYDFEEERPKKTVQEHISPFPRRYASKWGERRSMIDIHESLEGAFMDDGTPVVQHIFNQLRSMSLNAVPVCRLSQDRTHLEFLESIIAEDKNGLTLRIKLSELMNPAINSSIEKILERFGLAHRDLDLILDLETPQSFEPYAVFAKALFASLSRISKIKELRSLVIAGMSLDTSKIKKPSTEVVRHEWALYKHLLKALSGLREPTYGDYTIETPAFISKDMRLLNPAGKIVYATEDSWFIPKGNSFRENREQMIAHCKTIIKSGHYYGRYYSSGDKRIYDTVHNNAGAGNQGTWKEVGISHHITLAANQVARLHAS